jgi:cytochrome oxidase Cu insertion factor (SCO1/SenC/PrrC family)
MMKKRNVYIVAILLINILISEIAQGKKPIVLTVVNVSDKSKPQNISYFPRTVLTRLDPVEVQPVINLNTARYVIDENNPVLFSFNECNFIAEPGDNVVFEINHLSMKISGTGAAKYQLSYLVDSLRRSIILPANPKDHIALSVKDYLEWHNYTKLCVATILPVFEAWKSKLSTYAFTNIKARFLNIIIDHQSDKFMYLLGQRKVLNLSPASFCALYDSTYHPFVSQIFTYSSKYLKGSIKPVWFTVDRRFGFDFTKEGFDAGDKRRLLYLEEGKKRYQNEARESFIYNALYKDLIKRYGFRPEFEKLLREYYAEPGFPEYKLYMKQKVEELRRRLNAHSAPDFALVDKNEQIITKDKFKGKLILIDFWFTGCTGCVQMVPVMKKLEKEFSADTNIVFISVSIDKDKDKWLKSIAQQKYTSGGGLQLYTGGRGVRDSIIINNGISAYPSMIILDPYGRAINEFPFPDPRKDDGKKLTLLLNKHLEMMKDGPYLINEQDNLIKYEFSGMTVSKETVQQPFINYYSGYNQLTKVELKTGIVAEPSEFKKPPKLFSFSDIEGNLPALKKILQENKIIDGQLNWIFGNGHLVFGGDMFDRGSQVTECLWLIYSLEEKAKAAGGYVHFVLGNHEIMNLQGNTTYAHPKYIENAAKLNTTIKKLYGENSELGKWLRSKNIIEKIGDLLFVHGGIGIEFADSVKLNIDEVNQLARKHYADESAKNSQDVNTRLIFDGVFGPFWFRQYYDDKDKVYEKVHDTSVKIIVHKPTPEQMDNILSKYKVSHIITGHTIKADTISTYYANKVINTDTEHAKGKSEALFIEGTKFYRVNDKGQRWLLFDDSENGK